MVCGKRFSEIIHHHLNLSKLNFIEKHPIVVHFQFVWEKRSEDNLGLSSLPIGVGYASFSRPGNSGRSREPSSKFMRVAYIFHE